MCVCGLVGVGSARVVIGWWMPLASGGVGDGGASMLVTMLKSMLNEYAQRRHSSHEVHGTAAILRPGADGTTTPRRYSEDAQHWIGNV